MKTLSRHPHFQPPWRERGMLVDEEHPARRRSLHWWDRKPGTRHAHIRPLTGGVGTIGGVRLRAQGEP